MSAIHPPKPPADVETARKLLDQAGYTGWFVTEIPGRELDANLLRAERSQPAPKFEVAHNSPEVLVRLVAEVEARLPSKPVIVAGGAANTTSY